MSGPELDKDNVESHQHDNTRHADGGGPEYRPSSNTAQATIEQALGGHGGSRDIPQLVSMLNDEGRSAIAKKFASFTMFPGEVVLRSGALR